ncbi:expressed unknown protein [Seminavis robusta]|uniref:Uncharacterized protein n=1 Tax=Seminavis robusta TaxID=568900 RepID=A0A9N8H5H7_9STRA|nr:expressed unknown protein [Seminavis robusta]|eukprot:Sro114_g056490.1 n/a (219) ;mRNA; f:86379-87035
MMLHFDTLDGPNTAVFNRRRGPRPPKRVILRDGKQARQMLMGMALGWHVMGQALRNVYFTIKTQVEAQVLLVLVGPFLIIPLSMLAVPLLFLGVSAMMAVSVASNIENFTAFQKVVERQRFNLVRQKRMRMKSGRYGDDDDDDDSEASRRGGLRRLGRFGVRASSTGNINKTTTLTRRAVGVVPTTRSSLAPREISTTTRRGQILRSQSYCVQGALRG